MEERPAKRTRLEEPGPSNKMEEEPSEVPNEVLNKQPDEQQNDQPTEEPCEEPYEIPTSVSINSNVLAVFRSAAKQLTTRYNRHERLYKLSRDLCSESKKIICLLHSAVTPDITEEVLAKAKQRLNRLIAGPLKRMGIEQLDFSKYHHHRAVSIGMQEYVEARNFYSIISTGKLLPWGEAQTELDYFATVDDKVRLVTTPLLHMDYMLGLADLTGELMRRAINGVTSGIKEEEILTSCCIVKHMYVCFVDLSYCPGLSRKMETVRMNLMKVEQVLYDLELRKHHVYDEEVPDDEEAEPEETAGHN